MKLLDKLRWDLRVASGADGIYRCFNYGVHRSSLVSYVSWFVTHLGDLLSTYIYIYDYIWVIIHLIGTMDIPEPIPEDPDMIRYVLRIRDFPLIFL